MNWINTTWSQQAATVQPSSPAVVPSSAAPPTAPQTAAQDVSQQIAPPPAARKQPAGTQQQQQKPSESIEAMKSAAEQIEGYLRSIGRALEFRVDESTGRTVVTVRDSATGETIRQIPSEEALRLAHALHGQAHPAALVDLMA